LVNPNEVVTINESTVIKRAEFPSVKTSSRPKEMILLTCQNGTELIEMIRNSTSKELQDNTSQASDSSGQANAGNFCRTSQIFTTPLLAAS